jgi:hypothetical protein
MNRGISSLEALIESHVRAVGLLAIPLAIRPLLASGRIRVTAIT